MFFRHRLGLYAFVDLADAGKTTKIRDLLENFVDANNCVLSTQVLKEFANVCTKRFRLTVTQEEILEYVSALCRFDIVVVEERITWAAIRRHFSNRISFYASLIVEAAIAGGAEILYSEDLQHGMRFGALSVVNPFL